MGRSSASGRNAGNVAWNENEERKCRDRFMAIFNERYAHYFEFIGGRTSSKGKARLRCKVCGHEFERFGSFAQQGVNIYCPRCHVHRDDSIGVPADGHLDQHVADMFADGMAYEQIAQATGIDLRYIPIVIDRDRAERRAQAWRELDEARSALLRSLNALSRTVGGNRLDRVLQAATGRVGGYFKGVGRIAEHIERYAPTWATCSHCGKTYMFFPSDRRYGRKKAGPYCSDRCCAKANKTSSCVGHRLRKYGSGDKPRDSIKLDDVIERDHGICYICGCETTKEDHYYSRGWFTCGSRYPTIDHVVPLAHGGTHTWDNVRLACRQCNSIKRDSVA